MPVNNPGPDKYTNPHDELFKELITSFFKEFMELFWPRESKQIDFRTVKFLNQEFAIGRAQKKQGKKRLDIVAEVGIKGKTRHILIHVEHQSKRESEFPKRMFNNYSQLS